MVRKENAGVAGVIYIQIETILKSVDGV